MAQPIPDMVWIDMETTGLSINDDIPLELGFMVTDKFGHEIAHESWIIVDEFWKERVEDAKEDDLVGPMHRNNGLWFEWDQAYIVGQNDCRYVQDRALEWLDKKEVAFGQYPLAGSSLSLDREFLRKYLPDIDFHFNYRIIDVSSFKEGCKLWNPKVYGKLNESIGWQDNKAHRVIADIRDSIRELQYYQHNFLWLENGIDA